MWIHRSKQSMFFIGFSFKMAITSYCENEIIFSFDMEDRVNPGLIRECIDLNRIHSLIHQPSNLFTECMRIMKSKIGMCERNNCIRIKSFYILSHSWYIYTLLLIWSSYP